MSTHRSTAITLSMVGIGQLSRRNACCLHIVTITESIVLRLMWSAYKLLICANDRIIRSVFLTAISNLFTITFNYQLLTIHSLWQLTGWDILCYGVPAVDARLEPLSQCWCNPGSGRRLYNHWYVIKESIQYDNLLRQFIYQAMDAIGFHLLRYYLGGRVHSLSPINTQPMVWKTGT